MTKQELSELQKQAHTCTEGCSIQVLAACKELLPDIIGCLRKMLSMRPVCFGQGADELAVHFQGRLMACLLAFCEDPKRSRRITCLQTSCYFRCHPQQQVSVCMNGDAEH